MKYRSNSKEMMNKLGILAFYINIGSLQVEEVDDYITQIVDEFNETDESQPLNSWQKLYLPVRTGDTRIQVIRNDGLDDLGELSLTELKEQLIQFEIDKAEYHLQQQKDKLEKFKRSI